MKQPAATHELLLERMKCICFHVFSMSNCSSAAALNVVTWACELGGRKLALSSGSSRMGLLLAKWASQKAMMFPVSALELALPSSGSTQMLGCYIQ